MPVCVMLPVATLAVMGLSINDISWDSKNRARFGLSCVVATGTQTVRALTFSPEGTTLASAGVSPRGAGSVSLWDTGSPRLISRFIAHDQPVSCLVFSPDCKRVATGSEDGELKVWEIAGGIAERRWRAGASKSIALKFSHNSKFLVALAEDGTVNLWEVPTGRKIMMVQTERASDGAVAFTDYVPLAVEGRRAAPDGNTLSDTPLLGQFVRVRFVQVGFEHPEQFVTREPTEVFLCGD